MRTPMLTPAMRRAALAGFAALLLASQLGAQRTSADAGRLLRDIAVLADDAWEGRETCTPGNDSAAVFIARRFVQLGLSPLSHAGVPGRAGPSADAGADSYFHRYTARPQARIHQGLGGCEAQNVAAWLPGRDAALGDEYVVIGAHFDHLGRSTFGSRGVTVDDSIHNGADDNASGTAAVLELARLFRDAPPRRSIVFVAFSGEEWGLLGSQQFAGEALPPGRAQAMINFDMVGRLRDGRLLVYGTGTATEMAGIVDSANAGFGLRIAKISDGVGPSDHTSFYTKGIPVLHFFTDTHREYHTSADHADLVNATGTATVVDYAARVIRTVADGPALTLIPATRTAPAATPTGTRPYLGSVPDMAGGDIPGQRISDVTPGSPAEKAGLRAGDIVVEFGSTRVTDLQSYSDALSAHKPGDTVTVVVLRGTARVTLSVTLAARGG